MSSPGAVRRAASASPPDAPPADRSFPRAVRLLARREFLRVYDLGLRAPGPSLVVFAAPNGLAWSRLGLTVSRKFGGAVARNRMKRRLREIFRHHRVSLPGGLDLVVNVRQGSGTTSFARLEAEFCDQVRTVARRNAP